MDLLQYAFFQNALIGSLLTAIACGIVGTYIVSRRFSIYQRRDHACFVRWFGSGFLSGNKPDLDGDAVLHPLRFWCGVASRDTKRKGRFRHSGCMVAGYGFRSDLDLSLPGVHPELIRLSIW